MADLRDLFPYPDKPRQAPTPSGSSAKWFAGFALIALVWMAGAWLSTHRSPEIALHVAATQGPYPIGYDDPRAPQAYRTGDPVKNGTRLTLSEFSTATLGIRSGERLQITGPADLTLSATQHVSLNRGLFEWRPGQARATTFVFETAHGTFQPHPGAQVALQLPDTSGDAVTVTVNGLLDWTPRTRPRHSLGDGTWIVSDPEGATPAADTSGDPHPAAGRYVSGAIVDVSGQPIPTAEAALYRAGGAPRAFTPAGLRGLFESFAVPPGAYTLEARARGYIPSGIPHLMVPETGAVDVRIVLRRGESLMGAVVRAEDNRSIIDAIIDAELRDMDRLAEGERPFAARFRERAQHQGLFQFSGLVPDGRYRIRITAPGYAAQVFEDMAADARQVVGRLHPESVVFGRAATQNGGALAYATVAIESATRLPGAVALCDNRGEYRAGELAAGQYQVRVDGAQPASITLETGQKLRVDLGGAGQQG